MQTAGSGGPKKNYNSNEEKKSREEKNDNSLSIGTVMTKNNRERLIKLVVKHCDRLIEEGKKKEVLALIESELKHIWKTSDKKTKRGKQ